MATRSNPYYRSGTGLGEAIESLGDLFAPPAGADVAGWAMGAKTRGEAARAAELFRMAQDPNFNQQVFDRSNIASGNYAPNQSYHAVDLSNAATLRGQDITSGDNRYATDIGAQTTLSTNAADNERALMQSIIGAATAPVSEDAARPGFNPADFGVTAPAIAPFAGPRSAPTRDEVEADIIRSLPMGIQQQIAAGTDLETLNVLGPGGTPQVVTALEAVQTGATPADAGANAFGNYLDPTDPAGQRVIQLPRSLAGGLTEVRTPATEVNIGGEKGYDNREGTLLADTMNTSRTEAQNATAQLGTLRAMESAMNDPQFRSGAMQNEAMFATQLAQAVGLANPEAVQSMESFRALSNQAILAGLGGSLGTGVSNADRDYIAQTMPNLTNSEAGNREIIRIHTLLAQRKIDTANEMQRIADANGGRLPSDYVQQLSNWAESNPLFGERPAGSSASPAGGYAPKTQADYDAIPSGATYTAPDGSTRRKP